MVKCKKLYGEELPLLLSDPIVLEINHLQNQFKEKVKELITCQNEIKVFKATESLKDKAMEQLRNEASKLDERFRVTEDHLKQKNLEIKKLRDEKKEALAAQYAAEATLRRVHANQKNEDYVPIDSSFIATGATANIVRDYQRQISELQDEKRTLDRELARVKVSANRIANVMTNEWKDESHKVMPLRQWKEEKRIMQAEMQRLKDKLAISERRAKAESQQKEKLKVRLKALEEGFLYDRLQKEVIKLRKSCETKDISLQDKDEEIKMLRKKVDALTKAMEVEWKKMKREAAAREKEISSIKSPDDNRKNRNRNSSKMAMKER
ncbi:unnamed protein product [Vicia faba]|uniref:Uncharacterized protein n=1 Tax=Vicia faba TaxID=3906 RepID=A0AAV1AMB1_VICFA|nr:unnamed protein product [Vicia faba]